MKVDPTGRFANESNILDSDSPTQHCCRREKRQLYRILTLRIHGTSGISVDFVTAASYILPMAVANKSYVAYCCRQRKQLHRILTLQVHGTSGINADFVTAASYNTDGSG